jgi:hypothetical protein
MTPDFVRYLASTSWRHGPWWQREACRALDNGQSLIIPTRTGTEVYLLRCWLSVPVVMPSDVDGSRFESGESLLLHFFARGDDDEALHDHPWHFRTTILTGGYEEHLPPLDWDAASGLGPAWNRRKMLRTSTQTIAHAATDLHCVGRILPGTWTLVRTERRIRDWGFHPPGKPWVPYRQYLDSRRAPVTA